jgi:cell division protein FtsN
VIAGAFAYRNNAENLVIVLKTDGFPSASVVREKDGKHYVAYRSYSSRDDARSAKKDIEAAGKKGWILKY